MTARDAAGPIAESADAAVTADLRRDHATIRRGLALLEHAGRRLAGGRSVPASAVAELVDLLRRFADRCHHAKEEAHLYRAMRAKGLPTDERLRALLAAHGEGRDYLGTLAGRASRAELAAAALLYVRVMREHLDTEESEVFPLADVMFSADERAALLRGYAECERAAFGPDFAGAVALEVDRLEQAFGR